MTLRVAVVTVSDRSARGEREDRSGPGLAARGRGGRGGGGAARGRPRRPPPPGDAAADDLRRPRRPGPGAHDGRHRAWARATAPPRPRARPASGWCPASPRRSAPGRSPSRPTRCCRAPRPGVRRATLIVNLPGSPGGARDGWAVVAEVAVHAALAAPGRRPSGRGPATRGRWRPHSRGVGCAPWRTPVSSCRRWARCARPPTRCWRRPSGASSRASTPSGGPTTCCTGSRCRSGRPTSCRRRPPQPSPHIWFDPVPVVAAAAAATRDIRLGIGVTDVVRRHPASLAQTALTLDHLTGGRFVLGVGSGEALNLEPFGVANERPLSRLEDGLEVMRLLMASPDPVDYEGEHFRLRGASLGLRPVGDRPPPIWVAAHRPRGLALAGRRADGWLPLATDPDQYAEMLARGAGGRDRGGPSAGRRHPRALRAGRGRRDARGGRGGDRRLAADAVHRADAPGRGLRRPGGRAPARRGRLRAHELHADGATAAPRRCGSPRPFRPRSSATRSSTAPPTRSRARSGRSSSAAPATCSSPT